jgi:hypothetical protein
MQTAILLAALQRAAQAPALAGIYIKSVEIAAVDDAAHDPVLVITWSMPDHTAAISSAALSSPGVAATVLSRPADSVLRLTRESASLGEIEDAVFEAAWQLGAWDMVRLERPPLRPCATWREAGNGVAVSFGRNPYLIDGQPLQMGAAVPDELLDLAARAGYVTWRFVPLALSSPTMRRMWAHKDRTLAGSDATRNTTPGHQRARWAHPTEPGTAAEHQYRFGRGNHGSRGRVVPGTERQA